MSEVIKLTSAADGIPIYIMKNAILTFAQYKNKDTDDPDEFNSYTTISMRSPVTANQYGSFHCRVKETPEDIMRMIEGNCNLDVIDYIEKSYGYNIGKIDIDIENIHKWWNKYMKPELVEKFIRKE